MNMLRDGGRGARVAVVMVLLVWLAGCKTPGPKRPADPEMVRVTSAASQAFARGSLEQAARLYARALRRARAMDDAVEIGNNAYNLAACMVRLESCDEARVLLVEAKREFERAGRETSPVVLLEAKAARLMGQLDDAVALADRLLQSPKAAGAAYRLQAELLKVEVACDRADPLAARLALSKAAKTAEDANDAVLGADLAGVEARVFLLENAAAKAAAAFDRQAEANRKTGRYREMALALGNAGRAYLDAGILIPAGERFYRAARSLYAQGDDLAALKMIEQGLTAAEQSGDQDVLLRTTQLFDEISKQAEAPAPPAEPAAGGEAADDR